MGAASVPVAVGPLSRGHPGLTWGLRAFIWLLPFHIVVVAVLFGVLGWPMLVVRGIAAWKEATVALLLTLTVLQVVTGRSPRGNVVATDLAVAGLGTLALSYLIGASAWFAADLPVGLQLLGWRDDVFFMLLYFVGGRRHRSPRISLPYLDRSPTRFNRSSWIWNAVPRK